MIDIKNMKRVNYGVECDALDAMTYMLTGAIKWEYTYFYCDGDKWTLLSDNKPIELKTQLKPEDCLFGPISRCQHSWKPYRGFSESYDFCEKCDLKR